ncbi:MAG: deoxyribose-phosphate aldolase [Treponema sp.]|jgi:deoxyribose-phosphate aldolase|nr:deoxyribose-phosphate aldolase [Treponema sp.]
MTEDKKKQILSKVDYTLLKAASSWEQIGELCGEAIKYRTASVCVPPSYVKRAAEKYGKDLTICTAVGFPMGFATTETKVFETREAVRNGADEIDVVINIGDVKNRAFDLVEKELAALREAAEGKILKVIIETCYLEKDEKIELCKLVTKCGADFIKTSTGLGPGGAVLEDIDLFRANVGKGVRIKAAGGMRTAEDHEAFFDRGVDRIGSSSAIKALYGDGA